MSDLSSIILQFGGIELSGDILVVIGAVALMGIVGIREIFRRFTGSGGGLSSVGTDDIDADEINESSEGMDIGDREDSESLSIDPEFGDLLEDDGQETVNRVIEEENIDPEKIAQGEEVLPPHLDGDDIDPEDFLSKINRLHQRQIASGHVKKGSTEYKVGDLYRRVMFAHKHPNETEVGGIKSIIDDPTMHFDLTIHFHHIDDDRALRKAKSLFSSLDASVSVQAEEGDALSVGDKAVRKKKVRTYRDQIKQNDQTPIATTMYVSLRDEDIDNLRDQVDVVRDQFRTEAGIRLKTLERNQKEALVSASPIGIDKVYRDCPEVDPSHPMLGSSFGAFIASLSQSRKFEPEGHEWGRHSVQGHPIVKDPFQSPRNYNMVVVGESGSGKSLNTKHMALATKAVQQNTLIIILDPLQGFMGLAEALDAEKVTIGGKQNLNPMEIRKPPEEHIRSEAFDEDRDPLSAKVDDVMSFIQNYVGQQPGLQFGEESQLLRSLILESYKRKGITHDVQTHDNESPTLTDVLELANEARENPAEWAEGPQDPEDIEDQASAIGNILREFTPGGQYENLAQQTEQDIFGDNDVIYLDLSQQESSGGGGVGVVGQLMFSLAYEKCKQFPGPALYIVDEARFLFREADTLEYLVQRVRHSRHYNTSIRFITQEMEDFFDFEGASSIVSNSSFHIIHQSPNIEEWGHRFDLKQPHMEFVKNAATGSDNPYSQALVRFPEKDQYYPITIDLGERMLTIADFDEQEDRYEDLPGRGDDVIQQSPVARELVARIRHGSHSHEEALDGVLEDWQRPFWEMLSEDRAANALSRIQNGEQPEAALYAEALEQVREVVDATGGEEVVEEVINRLEDAIKKTHKQGGPDEPYQYNVEEVESETVDGHEVQNSATTVAGGKQQQIAANGQGSQRQVPKEQSNRPLNGERNRRIETNGDTRPTPNHPQVGHEAPLAGRPHQPIESKANGDDGEEDGDSAADGEGDDEDEVEDEDEDNSDGGGGGSQKPPMTNRLRAWAGGWKNQVNTHMRDIKVMTGITALVWGLAVLYGAISFGQSGLIALVAGSIVAVLSASVATLFYRVPGRAKTIGLAYPFGMNVVFLPATVIALYEPTFSPILDMSSSVGFWIAGTILAPMGLEQFFYSTFDLSGPTYLLMWFVIAFPVGWVVGSLWYGGRYAVRRVRSSLAGVEIDLDLFGPEPSGKPTGGIPNTQRSGKPRTDLIGRKRDSQQVSLPVGDYDTRTERQTETKPAKRTPESTQEINV
ncbi:transfer complex protein [Halorhabdus rudnickae]|uniref:transfer complex protein n=1 Tax=Halorhabdus rudnickae TaxID=1775544 RepID=UPI001AEF66BB|nr:transfer complex protein [Halorhabdus rudnickae]